MGTKLGIAEKFEISIYMYILTFKLTYIPIQKRTLYHSVRNTNLMILYV